jgi:sarcosine oxidase
VPVVETDVAVIGAGITGAAAAYELSRRGRKVSVVEQFAIGHDRGSSHGASRVFRLSYPDPAWIKLAQEALAGWRQLEADAGEALLRTTGSVDVGSYARTNLDALTACGVASSALDPDEALERWGLRLGRDEIAIFQPDAGVLAAGRAHNVLLDGARSHGAHIIAESRVSLLTAEDDHVRVTTSSGDIRAAVAVVAAGAWSARLLAPLGIVLPVTPTRETVAYLDLAQAHELPVLILERPGGVGEGVGTYALADAPGTLKVGVHRTGPETDPDEYPDPEPWVADWALDWVAERLTAADATLDRVETCIYTNTADEGFVLRREGRIVVASACSGHAFKFAPTTARAVAALVDEAGGDRVAALN